MAEVKFSEFGLFGNWLEEIYDFFKNSPISIQLFDIFSEKLDEFIRKSNFNEYLDTKDSVGSYCGISFKRNQLMYHCSDCALDETCVLCDKCFNFEAHKEHNFWYTIGSDNSGSCDCGEDDSWKNDLKCPHHQSCSANGGNCESENLSENISRLKEILSPILNEILVTFKRHSRGENRIPDPNEKAVLILYNDENHSFDDVIDILCTDIEISPENAEAYAKLVDAKGFAVILESNSSTCARISRKFKTLSTSVESLEMAFKMVIATELMAFLSEKISVSLSLRRYFVDWFLERSNTESSEFSNNLGDLFEADHSLWKSVRLGFSEILNSCNAINQESKKEIALTYCKQFVKIFDSFLKEKRESHLSVTNFSVQIFTLIPVAEYCLENSNILYCLFEKMVEILEPGFNPASGMEFGKLRNFNFQKFSILTHDALHLTRNVRSENLNIPNISKVLATFMYLLSLLTHQQGHFIKTGDHVSYDRSNYDNANILCYDLQKIGQELAKVIVNNCDPCLIWGLFEKYIDQRPSLYKLVSSNVASDDKPAISPLFKTKKRWSFFGSLGWFYAATVKEAISKIGAAKLSIPSKIVKCFAIDSLHRLMLSAEVRSGFWVRNGLIVLQQEHLYSAISQHNLTYYPDIFNCIIGGHLIDRIPYIEMIMKHSCITDYLQIQEQAGPIVDQLLVIFINCCSSKVPELNSDQILINYLSTDSLTKKSLIRMLPEWFIEDGKFREKILEISNLTSVNSIGADSKLEIKKQKFDCFDPFYWAFQMDSRLKAWSQFKEKRRNYLDHFYDLFKARYPLSAEISKEIDFLIELLLNFADSTSTDYEFSLELVLIILKAITSVTSDSECLRRVSNCIQKFKLKRNIPETIIVFLASICPNEDVSSDSTKKSDHESLQESKAKRKTSILANFKRQRDVFIGEPQASYEDDENTCVVCSESYSTKNESNFLGVPLQVSETSLMSINGKRCSLVRGCYHLIHKKCFESLPSASNESKFKSCTLCNSVIDTIIPLCSNVLDIPKDLKLIESDICFNTVISDPEAIDPLFYSFCTTLVYICETYSSFDTLSLHQILTLTQLKRHFIETFEKSQFFENVSDPVLVLATLVSNFIGYARSEVSLEQFNYVFKVCSESNISIDHINFALNLIMFESISRADIIVNSVQVNKSLCNIDFKLKLIDLPDRHDLFIKEFLNKKCDNCGIVPKSASICLLCGVLVCVGQLCCRSDSKHGECYDHRKSCGGDVGIFLMIRNCALLIVSDGIGAIVPAPYVNVFGEHDFDISSSSALFLNKQIYNGKLTQMWKNYELRDFILRNMDNSRITAHSWSVL